MKKIFLLVVIALILDSCDKDCSNSEQAKCLETPPTDEACQSYFQTWFYNKNTNSCEQKITAVVHQRDFQQSKNVKFASVLSKMISSFLRLYLSLVR